MSRPSAPPPLPTHWSPEQALAVFECLHALREQLWLMYGSAAQQAWLDQMQSLRPMPDFDPNDPF